MNGSITIRCDRDYPVEITIRDETSRCEFLTATISHQMFVAALGRLASVECDFEVGSLDRIGKTMEHKMLEFEIPESTWKDRKEVALARAHEECPEGWIPDSGFASQGSFFNLDGKNMARTTIRRWVEEQTP